MARDGDNRELGMHAGAVDKPENWDKARQDAERQRANDLMDKALAENEADLHNTPNPPQTSQHYVSTIDSPPIDRNYDAYYDQTDKEEAKKPNIFTRFFNWVKSAIFGIKEEQAVDTSGWIGAKPDNSRTDTDTPQPQQQQQATIDSARSSGKLDPLPPTPTESGRDSDLAVMGYAPTKYRQPDAWPNS